MQSNPILLLPLLLTSSFPVVLGRAQSQAAHIVKVHSVNRDGRIGFQQTTRSGISHVPADEDGFFEGTQTLRKETEGRLGGENSEDMPPSTDSAGKSKGRGRVKGRGKGIGAPPVRNTLSAGTVIDITTRSAPGQVSLNGDRAKEGALSLRRERERKLKGTKDKTGGKSEKKSGGKGKGKKGKEKGEPPAPAQLPTSSPAPTQLPTSSPAPAPRPETPAPHDSPKSPLETLNPICEICGVEFSVGSPDGIVSSPAQGISVSCAVLEVRGLNGEIPKVECEFLQQLVFETCSCARNAAPPTL